MKNKKLIKILWSFGLAGIIILNVFAGMMVGGADENGTQSLSKNEVYTPHYPIYINGNSGFTSANGVTDGSGTEANPYIIEGWDIDASSDDGIKIRNTDTYFIIKNCVIHDAKSNYDSGTCFYNVTYGKIDNVTYYNNRIGIELSDWSNNNTITNCNVYNNYYYGIYLGFYSSNNQITNCSIYNNSDSGIRLYSSKVNIISNCVIYNNSYGIELDSPMNDPPASYFPNNTIANCSVYSNSWDGIYLYYSSNNIITNCTVYNNSWHGIFLWDSSNNLIYNNYFNNTYNAYSYSGSGNRWNITKMLGMNIVNGSYLGGNYWSDYTGVDLYSGVAQDEIGSDGIGDTPYNISGGTNKDRYPLMSPWNITVNQPPIVNITYPEDGQTVNGTVTISGSAYDPDTSRVHNLNKDTWYQTIQAAVDDADYGNTIFVYSGVYYENVVINKTLTLIGENRNTTIIDGGRIGDVVMIEADWVNISVISIRNSYIGSSTDDAGIDIVCSYAQLVNCSLYANFAGINLRAGYNKIYDCEFYLNKVGISIDWSYYNSIINCSIWSNEYDGIVGVGAGSTNNIISGCEIYSNGWGIDGWAGWNSNIVQNCNIYNNSDGGIYFGIYASNNTVLNCSIYLNNGFGGICFSDCASSKIINCSVYSNDNSGIYISSCGNDVITNCYIYSNNGSGIEFLFSTNSEVTNCIISDNGVGISTNYSSDNNHIYYNNFINNTNQAHDICSNSWDNGSVGNYWSDYTGVDGNGDGIGDAPYNISGGSNQDNYPLMNPVNITLNKCLQKNHQPALNTILQRTLNGTTVQFVEIKIDDGDWQLANGTTSWSFDWDTTTVSNGWHTIYARAFDGIDYSDVVSVSIYVDNPVELPDLFVAMEVVYPNPVEGETITLKAKVFNSGNATAYNVSIRFYDVYSDVETIIDTITIPVVEMHEDYIVSVNWTAFSAGNHTISVVVDEDNSIEELDETNNQIFQYVTVESANLPDLTLTSDNITFSNDNPVEGETIIINVTVYNLGNATAKNVTIQFYDGNPETDGVLIDEHMIGSWGAYEIGTVSVNWTANPAGEHTIYVVVDPYDLIAELNETNNAACKGIMVQEVGNQPPVADFVFYEGVMALDSEYINITLKVTGEKYRVVNLSVYENGTNVGFVSVERLPGAPQDNTTSVLINSSKIYTIVLNYTAEEKGGNSVWVIIEYVGVRSFSYTEHFVFYENDTKGINLTEILDLMVRAIGLVKFDAGASYDSDGIIISYEWDFGDGGFGYGKIVWYAYDPGDYTVVLTVTDNSYSAVNVSKNVTILDYIGYFACYKKQFGVVLKCPADLTITDSLGRMIGYNDMCQGFENWIPNSSMILFGDIEIYFIPRDADYAYRVSGNDEGVYVFSVFDPGEYDPGEYGPGEYGPGEYTGKVYRIDSAVTNGSMDELVVGNGVVSVSSSDGKDYSLYIKYGDELFSLKNVHISGGVVHNYTVTDWSALSSTDTPSVKLEMFNGSILEAVQELCSGLFGFDLLKPDLVIVNVGVVGSLDEGEVVSFSVEILNKAKVTPASLAVARNVYVRLYVDDVYIGSSSIVSLIYSNSTAYTTVQWRVKSGSHTLRFVVYAEDDIDSGNNEYIMNVNIERKKPLIVIFPETAAVIAGAGIGAGLILFALLGTEIGKYKLLTLLAPLYMKTRKEELLDNYLRGKIHGYIIANPGMHYSLIKKSLDIKNGTLAYHLNLLEKENIIISKMDGVRRRFYPANMKIPEEIVHLNKTQQDIIEQIRKKPGISQKEIASLIGVSTQVVNYYIKTMAESNVIRLVRDGRIIRCYFVET